MCLAPVVVEQDAWRTVHLADDHPLGAVDDERAVLRHERHIAHVDVLFLDIENRTGFGLRVHFEHDQAERDAHWRGIGNAALTAFVGIELGIFQFVMDEIQLGRAGEIADREHTSQRFFQARHIARCRIRPQKLFVALALDLDQVRHLRHFVDVAEDLADAGAVVGVGRLGCHRFLCSPCKTCGTQRQLMPACISAAGHGQASLGNPAPIIRIDMLRDCMPFLEREGEMAI